jgi:hypothetical protein
VVLVYRWQGQGRDMELNTIEIWDARWHDRTVLINPIKVAAHNKIIFTKSKSLGGNEYYASGNAIKSYSKESNGRIDCYVVPLDDLEKLATPENNKQRRLV